MSDITVKLNNWRGYSAYEVAVNNGYEGTEQQWLASLKGADGKTTSVNGQTVDAQGAITITGADIAVAAGGAQASTTIAALGLLLKTVTDTLTFTESAVDFDGKYIDNAVFR